MWRTLVLALALAATASADAVITAARVPVFQPELDRAFSHLYSSDFAGAHGILDRYIGEHPADPVGYSVRGATYLFSELDRLGILESDFFESDKKISDPHRNLRPDAQVHDRFYAAITQAQSIAQSQLGPRPNDANALFAMCLSLGTQTDYMALIEKRQMASLGMTKRAYREAKLLIANEPQFYDAYLTTGFTEYIFSALPGVVRWFVKFDDVTGDRQQALRNLRLVAEKGHYLQPLAKILLATASLRDKKPREAQRILQELTLAYPANPLLKRELEKVSARVRQQGG